MNIGSTFVAMALVDKLGRKPLLIAGSLGMTVSLGTMAVVFATAGSAEAGTLKLEGTAGIAALLAANVYVFFFVVSWGPLMYIMLGEMFKNRFRGAALSLSGFAQWISNFAITMTFPILLAAFGLGGDYGIYTLFALVSIFFVWKLVKETKGKTLEEI